MQETRDLLIVSTRVWEQAARDEIPVVVAAFMTNVAFAAFEEVEQRLKVLCDGCSPDTLLEKFSHNQSGLEVEGSEDGSLLQLQLSQVEALLSAWQLLLQFKVSYRTGQAVPPSSTPAQITVRRGPQSTPMDRECHTTMLGNVGQHLRAQHRPTSIVLMSPLYAELGYFVTCDENDNNGLRCSHGLQLLLETYKSYLLSSQCHHAPSSCRLQALRFAQQLRDYIVPVLNDSSMPVSHTQRI